MSDPLLSIKNLDIAYGETKVVKNFSLDVAAGDFVSILGPSGCGKTTTLRAIAGFIPVESGNITLNNKDITRLPPEARDVGIVFQNYALFPSMTAYENIAFGLRVAKKSNKEIEQRVTAIAKNSGIYEQLQKKPADMSGGQQQRVAIARALIMGANVLLFDEPLSNLDAKVRVSMRKEIKRLQKEFDFTAFFVTHDQDEALALSDKIIVLNEGEIQQIGTARELYESPTNPFVCQFIGESNVLSVALTERLTGQTLQGSIFIRPEHIKVAYSHSTETAGLSAVVTHIEYLGSEVRIECLVDDEFIHAVLYSFECPEDLEIDDQVYLSVNGNSLHVFQDV